MAVSQRHVPILHIVLVSPEIPPNTGNVARTCVALGARLHLIRPLGFSLSDRALRRAGMDYWREVSVSLYDDWNAFTRVFDPLRCYYFVAQGGRRYSEAEFSPERPLVFGCESRGLPPEILAGVPDELRLTIPMRAGTRSLNLASSVALAAYEAARQQGFPGLIP